MPHKPPRVWIYRAGQAGYAELECGPALPDRIRLDTPAWAHWLATSSATSFAYPIEDPAAGWRVGFMTVRKERRARGGSYWVAYRRIGGQLRKIYWDAVTR